MRDLPHLSQRTEFTTRCYITIKYTLIIDQLPPVHTKTMQYGSLLPENSTFYSSLQKTLVIVTVLQRFYCQNTGGLKVR